MCVLAYESFVIVVVVDDGDIHFNGVVSRQSRINHCAGCTMGRPPPPGAPDQLPIFYHVVLTCKRSGNVWCRPRRNDD